MEKIEKPKRTGKLNHNLTFTECLAEDYYIHGMQFENEEISYLSIERLSLNQCHFKNVVFLECEFDHIDLTDTIFENCDLSNIKMPDGIIHRCIFQNCRLTGSDFSNCGIQQTLFKENSGRYINFSFSTFKK